MHIALYLLIAAFYCTTAFAQQLPLETYTPANGLVDARVTKMFQDSRGRMYFLTREGFSIFDGQEFSNYGLGVLYSEIFNCINEDSRGIVNLYSFSGNIYRVNGNKVTVDSSHVSLLSEVSVVLPVSSTENLIVTNRTLVKEKNNQFEKLNLPFSTQNFNAIDNILWANPYALIAKTLSNGEKSLYLYHYQKAVITDSMINTGPGSIIRDNDGNFFFHGEQLLEFDKTALANGKIRLVNSPLETMIPKAFKKSLPYFDNYNNVWICSSKEGFCKINRQSGAASYYTVEKGVLSNSAFAFQDKENNYWLASGDKGVQKLQQSPLAAITTLGKEPAGIVKIISTDENNNAFIHTVNALFLNNTRIAPAGGTLDEKIYWAHHQYWTFEKNTKLKGSAGTVYDLSRYGVNSDNEILQSGNGAVFDKEKRLIIAGNVLFIIDKNLKLTCIKPPYYCDNVVVDSSNSYWCFTRSNMAVKYEWKDGQLKETARQYCPNLNPRCATLWKDSFFVIGTRHDGIKIYERHHDTLRYVSSINRQNGLSNNFVNSILAKNRSQLLAGTGTGIDLISITGSDTTTENLTTRINVFSTFINMITLKDSTTLCQTIGGDLFLLNKETRLSAGFTPHAFFKIIKVNETVVDSTFATFRYNMNNLSFGVSAPSFLDNKNTRFHFMLSGNENKWDQFTGNPVFSINNLPPGNYTLTVTVHYPGRFYPDEKLHYRFTIKKPYWQQWWFLILVLLAVAFTAFFAIRSFYRRQLQKQRTIAEKKQAIEKERTRIATDMHDDFGASLSRIKFLSEKIKIQYQEKEMLNKDLDKISDYSDEMAEKMNEIVWALNQKYDTLGDWVAFCRAYASEYTEAHQMALFFEEAVSERPLQGETRRNLFLVLKECLHNTVKHAKAGKVQINIREQDNQLYIKIRDDGQGMDANHIRPFANGMENMKKRIADCGGQIQFYNEGGMVVAIEIPLHGQAL
jgi:signal transduction histidine kinase